MLSSLIIVFREVLEAALVIGIVCAATRGIKYRTISVIGGMAIGLCGAGLVALFADSLASVADGMGQELFNALVLLVVVAMLAWHNMWMSAHSVQLVSEANQVGESVRQGSERLTVLVILVGLAVLREGAEVVLFLYGISANGSEMSSMVLGSSLGLLLGVVVGFALYLGLLRIPTRSFFTVTTAMLVLLAAGMAGQAAKFLIQADYVPALGYDLWDSSWLIPNGSLTGEVLRTLIGYDAQPAGMQLLFYVTTLVLILIGMYLVKKKYQVAVSEA